RSQADAIGTHILDLGKKSQQIGGILEIINELAEQTNILAINATIEAAGAGVNTTVMATEGGSKAVDLGTRQFGEVAASFKQIAGLVATTADAAKEIELSTKQQTTAVEQVNVAVVNVSQAARETEASSTQTLQTSSQLTALSRNLAQLIQPQEHA